MGQAEMRTSSSPNRSFLILVVLALSAIAGLAMASVQGTVGPDLLARWLVGWAAVAFILIPAVWLVRRGPAPHTAIARRPRRPARHPGRLG
jgi:hypothetical protein